MKLMQVFDCQDMPSNIREEFFDVTDDMVSSNDVHINWYVGECDDTTYEMYGEKEDAQHRLVDTWLKEDCGTELISEEVLIKRWW